MIHIIKKVPKEFVSIKKKCNGFYQELGHNDKEIVLNSLMKEQGYICAYCMKRIPEKNKKPNVSIEHIVPQSLEPEKAMDYHNMLAVCNGNRGEGHKKYMTCDAYRGNAKMVVNPCDKDIVDTIGYKTDGTIYSDDSNINRDLNESLNLNGKETLLKEIRKEVLSSFILNVKAKHTNDFASFCKKKYSSILESEYKQPYCGIILWWLKRKNSIQKNK